MILSLIYDYKQLIVISLLHFTFFIYTCSDSQTDNRRCRSYMIKRFSKKIITCFIRRISTKNFRFIAFFRTTTYIVYYFENRIQSWRARIFLNIRRTLLRKKKLEDLKSIENKQQKLSNFEKTCIIMWK